ncbi:beta-ketoacyl synthase N-terminal-like domain-containing protein [Vibrio gazogenes]|uniref:Beta-ketoacyl synthase-like N-terminal domain-containing protein n=1 Tax=Vibrio gazogenes TaxID=687 RepID=A0A1Z2SFW4_VIBGA|nr:beta-ketoacyl synthase N-terminal-like domain-containing protein [Vibrio gazogenes]ASA56073.1 hypothetical protein BSQ33_10440 [Vibrio gazogenes]
MNKPNIAILGYGAVFPRGEFNVKFSTQETTNERQKPISRQIKRAMSPSAASAITATEHALSMAKFDPEDKKGRVGLYAGQYGYLNPTLSDFQAALDESDLSDSADHVQVFRELWYSNRVSPFLLTNILNNNILGMLSLHWGITGDSGAFIRDSLGSTCALQDAVDNLRYGECDIAVVACAGSQESDLGRQSFTHPHSDEFGAVTLILARADEVKPEHVQGYLEFFDYGFSHLHLSEQIQSYLSREDVQGLSHDLHHYAGSDSWLQDIPATASLKQFDFCQVGGTRGCPGILASIVAALQFYQNQSEVHRYITVSGDNRDYLSVAGIRKVSGDF